MKKLIKKWLGIPDHEKLYSDLKNEIYCFYNETFYSRLLSAIFDAFHEYNECDETIQNTWTEDEYLEIRRQMYLNIKSMILPSVTDTIASIVVPETFIDDIIERIKRKQLN